jgi:transketolase C-terminal domain/subunit
VVSAPKDENELQHLLYTAAKLNHPIAIRYPRGSGLGVQLDRELGEIPIGKGEIVREGKDVASYLMPILEAPEDLGKGRILKVPWQPTMGESWARMKELKLTREPMRKAA